MNAGEPHDARPAEPVGGCARRNAATPGTATPLRAPLPAPRATATARPAAASTAAVANDVDRAVRTRLWIRPARPQLTQTRRERRSGRGVVGIVHNVVQFENVRRLVVQLALVCRVLVV